jgi:hypothetical protein
MDLLQTVGSATTAFACVYQNNLVVIADDAAERIAPRLRRLLAGGSAATAVRLGAGPACSIQ